MFEKFIKKTRKMKKAQVKHLERKRKLLKLKIKYALCKIYMKRKEPQQITHYSITQKQAMLIFFT